MVKADIKVICVGERKKEHTLPPCLFCKYTSQTKAFQAPSISPHKKNSTNYFLHFWTKVRNNNILIYFWKNLQTLYRNCVHIINMRLKKRDKQNTARLHWMHFYFWLQTNLLVSILHGKICQMWKILKVAC